MHMTSVTVQAMHVAHASEDMDGARPQVTNGKNAMPAWADRLSEEEIQDVAAYVFNQATNSLW